MPAPLNVLFITADQWRGDCLSAVGHPVVKTPHLDALAAEGVLFARHFANTAPCGPSRATLHTGLYAHNHRSITNGTPLEARHTNWALESGRLGYDPVLFGYTDTSVDPGGLDPHDPALTTYEGALPGIRTVCEMSGAPRAWTDWLEQQGYQAPGDITQAYGWRRAGLEYEDGAAHPRPLAWPAEVDDTAFLTVSLIAYLRQARDPFVAHLSLLRPHPPFVAPEPYNARYDPMSVPDFTRRETREAEGEQHPWLAWQLSRPGFRPPASEKRLRRLKAVYYGLISRVDDAIGMLMSFLRESGLLNRTLIIFTSDHGEQLGDHWLLGKGGYFDGSYHIPLIVRDPRPEADAGRGRVVGRFTENVDVMPTLLGAIGADIPGACDGADLVPFITGRQPPLTWREAAHWEYDFRNVANDLAETQLGITLDQCALSVIRDTRFKYVHFTKAPPLLFDLAHDPGEMTNVAGDPAYQPMALACAQALISWRMNHEARALTHTALTSRGLVTRASPRY